MKRHIRTLFVTLILVLCSTALAVALSDEEARGLLREAHDFILYSGDVDSATKVYDQIVAEYAGSKWAAIALLKKADLAGTWPERISLYEQVVAEYPNTASDINARLHLIGIENRDDLNAEIEATSLLAVSLGGPSLNEVLSSNNHQASEKVFALPVETRKLLGPIYWTLWCMMCNPYSGLDRPGDAMELARLLREVFEPLDVSVGNSASTCLRALSGGEILFGGKKIQAPQVQILEPSEGGVVSSRPTFKVEISAGDLEHRQVDLAKTEFLLDGMDLMPLTAVRAEFSLQPGEPFERLSLVTELSEPLAPGPHTLSLVVPLSFDDSGAGTTTALRTFQVEGPSKPISLNLTLHSKHVMPHRNQRVELEVTPSGPANLVFTLYRVANRNLPNDLGEPVYSQTATGVSSSFTFTWEGQTTTGEPAHNGNYELVVAAGGVSQSVSVQVNRQQGKQSWLKLGTQTLAYLGRPTLMGSLGYAFLPGVTWLASLGEPAAGEKVALGG